ncbi:MAG: hypothetical protein ABIG90_03330 [bacterium]
MTIQQKIFLNILIIILVLFVLIFLLFWPLLARVQKLSRTVEQQRMIIENPNFQKQYQAQITQLKQDYQEIEPKLPLLKQSILEKERAVEFIKILENAAEQTNLIQEIKAQPEKKDNKEENSLVFNLILTGSFPNFLRFLETIENNQYLLQAKKIQIKVLRDKEKQLTGEIQSNVEIKVYLN